jgi:RNA polymerase sigma factor (sigma-70 family)
MGRDQLGTLLRYLRQVSPRAEPAAVADADLLDRFLRNRDEAAFEVLVWRHGKMVWNLCRRLLRHTQDVEDAFQATFLALVRKGRSIHQGASLSSWLYKVAYRVALRARASSFHSARALEEQETPVCNADDTSWRDLRPVLDEEIGRLPEKYRAAVILCYLEGHSTAEAAALLGCPRGTVLSRLATARQRLQRRLLRRGVTLTLAGLTVRLVDCAGAALPAPAVTTTCAAALGLAAGKAAGGVASARAVVLMEGVLRTMFLSKLKLALLLAAVVLLAGLGLSRWGLVGPNRAEAFETDKKAGDQPASPPRDRAERHKPAVEEERPDTGRVRVPVQGDGLIGGLTPPQAVVEERPDAGRVTAQRPVGNWERTFGPLQVNLRVKAERLTGTVDVAVEKQRISFVFDADYSVTRDGVLYGVITGMDIQGAGQGTDLQEAGRIQVLITQLIDTPFSIRYRVDDGILTVKDVKFGTIGLKDEKDDLAEVKMMAVGRYKQAGTGGKERPW